MTGYAPAAILALFLGIPALQNQASALPELPQLDLKEFDPVIQEQVRDTFDAVLANPRDAAANGKLAMLLEVYKRRELAAICYARAHQLDRNGRIGVIDQFTLCPRPSDGFTTWVHCRASNRPTGLRTTASHKRTGSWVTAGNRRNS